MSQASTSVWSKSRRGPNRELLIESYDSLAYEYKVINISESYEQAFELCVQMDSISSKLEDWAYIIKSELNFSTYYLATDKYEEAFESLNLAKSIYDENRHELTEEQDNILLCIIYNILALYHINYDLDYALGMRYLIDGMAIAKEHSFKDAYAIATYNIVSSNFIREDESGLEFAKQLYEQGEEWNDQTVKLMGAISLSMMYYLTQEYDLAQDYIEAVINSETLYFNRLQEYTLYANILNAKGNYRAAERAYNMALEHINTEMLTVLAYTYLSYGKFLIEQDRPHTAIEMLKIALSHVNKKNGNVYLYQIYYSISEAYQDIGDNINSLDYYRKYHQEYAEMFGEEKERQLKELTLAHQSILHKAEIKEYERRVLILILLAVVVLSFSVVVAIMYRNRNRLYTKIAKHYKVSIDREAKLLIANQEQEQIIENYQQKENHTKSTLSIGANEKLFLALEDLMKTEKIFKDQELSQEQLAKKLETNRTYLSQVINENTSKNFLQYVNSYRIEEALRLLSDTANDYLLKTVCYDSGFASRTTFYRLFKESVGMSPTKYAELIKQNAR